VFDPCMEWEYYWKFLVMGVIGMTFLGRLFTWNMSCNYLIIIKKLKFRITWLIINNLDQLLDLINQWASNLN